MNSKIIGQRINAALALRNVKQKELATAIGLPHENIISYWCNGKRKPNIEQITQIAKFLNVSTDYLLGTTTSYSNENAELRAACDYTGLSEKLVEKLHTIFTTENLSDGDIMFDVLNFYEQLTFEFFDNEKEISFKKKISFCDLLGLYLETKSLEASAISTMPEIFKPSFVGFNSFANEYPLFLLQQFFVDNLKDFANKYRKNKIQKYNTIGKYLERTNNGEHTGKTE